MAFGVYKRGQGSWSRGVAAASLAALGIWAAIETHDWCSVWFEDRTYAQWWVPGLLLAGFLAFAYWLTNRPKAANFLIETQTEMKKVTWPTYREVLSATTVVIIVVLLLGAFLFGIDRLVVEPLFKLIRILPAA